jgi:hypothetical protein
VLRSPGSLEWLRFCPPSPPRPLFFPLATETRHTKVSFSLSFRSGPWVRGITKLFRAQIICGQNYPVCTTRRGRRKRHPVNLCIITFVDLILQNSKTEKPLHPPVLPVYTDNLPTDKLPLRLLSLLSAKITQTYVLYNNILRPVKKSPSLNPTPIPVWPGEPPPSPLPISLSYMDSHAPRGV